MQRCVLSEGVWSNYALALGVAILFTSVALSGTVLAQDAQTANEPKKRTFLGVVTVAVDPSLRDYLDLKKGFGVQVVDVRAGSPAETVGLEVNDILILIDDQRVTTSEHLATLIQSLQTGDQTEIAYLRKGRLEKVAATLTERIIPRPTHLGIPRMPRYTASPEDWRHWQECISKLSTLSHGLSKVKSQRSHPLEPQATSQSTIRIKNTEGRVIIVNRSSGCRMTITDVDGKTIYNDVYSRQKGIQSLPKSARDHLEKMRVDRLAIFKPAK